MTEMVAILLGVSSGKLLLIQGIYGCDIKQHHKMLALP
jgi:hypothetical protein